MDEEYGRKTIVYLGMGCNSNCIFCLQDTRTPKFFDDKKILSEIIEGKNRGSDWLILSGGEASIHPKFLEFVAFAKKLGYRRIQTISNGRMFSIKNFAKKAKDAGLTETTISFHGSTKELHDGLTRTPGSFVQAKAAAKNCEDLGIKLSFNTAAISLNVLDLKNILKLITEGLGLKKKYDYDIIGVSPTGRAWVHKLFPSHDDLIKSLKEVCEYAEKNNIVLWITRTPLQDIPKGYQHHKEPWEVLSNDVAEFWNVVWVNKKMCPDLKCKYCEIQPICEPIQSIVKKMDLSRLDFITGKPDKLKMKKANNYTKNFLLEDINDAAVVKEAGFVPSFETTFNGSTDLEAEVKKVEVAMNMGIKSRLVFEVNKKTLPLTKKPVDVPVVFSPANPYPYVRYFYDKSNYIKDVPGLSLPFSKIKFEGNWKNVPLCIHFGGERKYWINLDDFDLDMAPKPRDFAKRMVSDTRVYDQPCFECKLKDKCPGFFGDYVKLFGFDKVSPF